MDIVTVYHGTSKRRADEVVKCGFLSVTTSQNQRYGNTCLGKIYVTSEFYDAMDFSIRPELYELSNYISVFKIEIDYKELTIDVDELVCTSTLTESGAEKCFTIDHNLMIGTEVVALYEHSFESDKKAINFIQKLIYEEERIDETKWKILCHV